MAKHILIIDDDPVVRGTLKTMLEDTYHILLSRSTREGLKMLSENTGLVFLDYKLPDSTGFEVLPQIKKTHPSIPVIFITAYGSEDVCQNAFRLGARDYIKNPFLVKKRYVSKLIF